jgi:hypothetical protein
MQPFKKCGFMFIEEGKTMVYFISEAQLIR